MPELEANGLRIAYRTEGQGPPLVLLHAATSSAMEDWAAQRPLLRQHFTLYLPDARGHAGTRWDTDQGWSHGLLVDDLLALADGLGLERFHVAGLSMGAGTALAFAIRHPERLRSAVLAAVGVEPEPRNSVARRLMDPERLERDDPAWAARLARRHDPTQGARRLAEAAHGDPRRHPRTAPPAAGGAAACPVADPCSPAGIATRGCPWSRPCACNASCPRPASSSRRASAMS